MGSKTEWVEECQPSTVNECFKRSAKRDHEAALSFWKHHNAPKESDHAS